MKVTIKNIPARDYLKLIEKLDEARIGFTTTCTDQKLERYNIAVSCRDVTKVYEFIAIIVAERSIY